MSQEVTFIWERNNENIIIQPNKQYLFYYRGCFCPPHSGHFSQAIKYLKYPNVRMIIHQIGGKRHGIPSTLNRQIWKWYIEELLPINRVELIQYNNYSHKLPLDHPWMKRITDLVLIRGDEFSDIESYQKKEQYRWKAAITKCKKYKINLTFLYGIRDSEKLSATAFTKSLIAYQENLLKVQDLYQYLPSNLNTKTKNKIIHLLAKHDLR